METASHVGELENGLVLDPTRTKLRLNGSLTSIFFSVNSDDIEIVKALIKLNYDIIV